MSCLTIPVTRARRICTCTNKYVNLYLGVKFINPFGVFENEVFVLVLRENNVQNMYTDTCIKPAPIPFSIINLPVVSLWKFIYYS